MEIEARHDGTLPCPECKLACSVHDRRTRRWRHLDTCRHQTILVASIPRVNCAEHGVRQVHVPWAEPGSTALMEGVVIDWLMEASMSAVAKRFRLTWDQIAGIQARTVTRGLARRELEAVSMDMWPPYITIVEYYVPNAEDVGQIPNARRRKPAYTAKPSSSRNRRGTHNY